MIPYRRIRGDDINLKGRVESLERQIVSIMEISESNTLNIERKIGELNKKNEELLARLEALLQTGEG